MADDSEKTGGEANLELPSLFGFRRKNKRKQGRGSDEGPGVPASPTPPVPAADPALDPAVEPVSTPDGAAAPELEADSDPLAADPVAEPRGGLAPAEEKPKRLPPVPPPAAGHDGPGGAPHHFEQAHERRREQKPDLRTDRGADPDLDVETQVLPSSASHPQPHPQPQPQPQPVPAAAAPAPAASRAEATSTPAVAMVSVEEPVAPTDGGQASAPAARPSAVSLPALNPWIASFLTGVVVGIAGVLLGFLAGRGCEVVRGVGSCGRIGAFALVLILAVQVVLGAALFKAWRFTDPVSTSLLGVGLFAVLVMLFLLGSLTSLWTLVFVPVLSGLTYLLSGWVTSSFGEEANRG